MTVAKVEWLDEVSYDIPFAVCSPVHYFKLLVHFSHTSGFAPSETWIVLIVCGYHAITELLAKL